METKRTEFMMISGGAGAALIFIFVELWRHMKKQSQAKGNLIDIAMSLKYSDTEAKSIVKKYFKSHRIISDKNLDKLINDKEYATAELKSIVN